MSGPRDEIKIEGSLLEVGQSQRIRCPFCHGGTQGERSMVISRTGEGVLFNCHRAGCLTGRGFEGASAATLSTADRIKKAAVTYDGETLPLENKDLEYFRDRFEIIAGGDWDDIVGRYIFRTEEDEYLFPIIDRGHIRGYNVRQPSWGGSPAAPRKGRPGRPRSRVFMENQLPAQSTYAGPELRAGRFLERKHVVLVEDQLSAMKVAQLDVIAYGVALMGTDLNVERVREIAMLRPDVVYLAFDADATSLAFKHAREFGLAFPKVRVVILEKDLKDTKLSDIPGVLGL
jgi:hypothetical protein